MANKIMKWERKKEREEEEEEEKRREKEGGNLALALKIAFVGKLEDRWGYQVATSSQACVSAINSYYHQVPHFTSCLSLSDF